MIDPALAKDPMLSTLAKEPIDPIDSIDPTEPMLRIELREPIDRIELLEPKLHREVGDGAITSSCRTGDSLLREDG